MASNPIQAIEQGILNNAETEVEQIQQADPQPVTTPTWEQINDLAGKLWLATGGKQDDPLTLNHWLEAQATLLAEAPEEYNG